MPETSETVWENSLRYVVYSTVGCYFTRPSYESVQTQGGTAGNDGDPSHGVDGDTIKVLRPSAEKLCFPAVSTRSLSMPQPRTVTDTVVSARSFRICSLGYPSSGY